MALYVPDGECGIGRVASAAGRVRQRLVVLGRVTERRCLQFLERAAKRVDVTHQLHDSVALAVVLR